MTQQELNEKVAASIAKGCKLPVEKIEAIFLKEEKNAAKNAKRSAAGFDRRAAAEKFAGPVRDIAEIFRENAEKNLPSSMR